MARKDKNLALKLRKQGKGYNLISKELGIPKGTLSGWFSREKWSRSIKEKLAEQNREAARGRMQIIAKANQARWLAWRAMYRKEAENEFYRLKNNTLFVAGIMVYWAEGDNGTANGNVRLTNTDPRMVRLFVNFAEKICKVSREDIRVNLILYPDLSDSICKKYWSDYLKIPEQQFYKTQYIKGRHPTKRLEKGICMVKIGGTGLKKKSKPGLISVRAS